MNLELGGKVVLVTGAGSGIGRAAALAFSAEGASVGVLDLNAEAAASVAAEIRGASARADVADPSSVKEAFARIRAELGPADVLVNCAGLWYEAPDLELPLEKAKRQAEVNLWGVVHCCREAVPDMIAKRAGKIVSIASDAGRIGEKNMATYSASKAGVISYSRALARELGRHWINVNVVCPSIVDTPMIATIPPDIREKIPRAYPLRRLGRPDDIADAVLFLCSARASWITGQAISVDGGYVMA
jgi:2-hydroxycyclohexanecarboxyl-CoA dehydrogenase